MLLDGLRDGAEAGVRAVMSVAVLAAGLLLQGSPAAAEPATPSGGFAWVALELDPSSTSSTLTDDELLFQWTVRLVPPDGGSDPTFLLFDASGRRVGAGSATAPVLTAMAHVGAGELWAYDGPSDADYIVSADRSTVTAANDAARDLVGAQPVRVRQFRARFAAIRAVRAGAHLRSQAGAVAAFVAGAGGLALLVGLAVRRRPVSLAP